MKLNDIMEFNHVVRVDDNGNVTDATGIYAPELHNDHLYDESWELMDGYSRQDGYSGPIMHDSELIGGQMEKDILANPGYYVALVSYYLDEENDETEIEGWAIAYRETI